VLPSSINVRSAPSFDAEVIASVPEGRLIVAGRDALGQFLYVAGVNGWVNADPAYVDLGNIALELLPIHP
jgi:hypothetical protein